MSIARIYASYRLTRPPRPWLRFGAVLFVLAAPLVVTICVLVVACGFGASLDLAVLGGQAGVCADKTPAVLTGIVGAVAALLATVGWLFQRHTAAGLARKQHTINVLLSLQNSELYNTHRVNMRTRYPPSRRLTTDQAERINTLATRTHEYAFDARTGRAVYPPEDSAMFILNYYEFIAISVMRGDMDEHMVRTTEEPTIKSLVTRFWLVIREDLGIETFGKSVEDPYAPYVVLYNLARRWGLTRADIDAASRVARSASACDSAGPSG